MFIQVFNEHQEQDWAQNRSLWNTAGPELWSFIHTLCSLPLNILFIQSMLYQLAQHFRVQFRR